MIVLSSRSCGQALTAAASFFMADKWQTLRLPVLHQYLCELMPVKHRQCRTPPLLGGFEVQVQGTCLTSGEPMNKACSSLCRRCRPSSQVTCLVILGSVVHDKLPVLWRTSQVKNQEKHKILKNRARDKPERNCCRRPPQGAATYEFLSCLSGDTAVAWHHLQCNLKSEARNVFWMWLASKEVWSSFQGIKNVSLVFFYIFVC